MHISKKYNEIHGRRKNLTIRKHAKILTILLQFRPKTLDSTDTVDFTHFRRTVNRYCDTAIENFGNYSFIEHDRFDFFLSEEQIRAVIYMLCVKMLLF